MPPKINKSQKQTINLLHKISGQISGIENMIREKRSCEDIIQQIIAARAGLEKIGREVLKNEAEIRVSCKNQDPEKFENILKSLFKIT